jgi:outer membrane lipoprotein SlyB
MSTATSTAHPYVDAPARGGVSASAFSRPAALIGGATALIALTAIATTLVVKPAAPVGDPGREARSAPIAAQSMLSGNAADPSKSAVKSTGRVGDEAAAAAATAQNAKPAATRVAAAAAPSCPTCGVVEAVTPFQKKGEASGVGAVGGAVLGGVLGNQVGGGNGKKAMTVIGAVGGGMAGHEIEKRQRATTLYAVKVRMQDGSVRTINQATAPTVGQKVTVEGQQVKARA